MTTRLAQQFAFLTEADRLKTVLRATELPVVARRENAAEHSWHVALWALLFAGDAPGGVDLDRSIAMLLLHDLVEVDAGDQPIHLPHDRQARAAEEAKAAERLFGLLPAEQGERLHALWTEFDAGETPSARFARACDVAQPIFEELARDDLTRTDRDVLIDLLTTGRAAGLADDWPELHGHAVGLLSGPAASAPAELDRRLRFLAEADRLKTVHRATTLHDGSRRENTAEHCWHVALYALVLSEHAAGAHDAARVVRMLLLHDLVEIDAGDVPIHGGHDPAEQFRKEAAAARRIFGLLPGGQADALHALWVEFEGAESSDAVFAKSIDRLPPVVANLETGGGTWSEYAVTREQLERRVGDKVRRGAPAVWDHLVPRLDAWFSETA